MIAITITGLSRDILVALARGAAEHGDTIEDEARRVLQRLFGDTRGQAQQSWARRQMDLHRWSKMPSVRTSPIELLRVQRLDRDAMISERATLVLAS